MKLSRIRTGLWSTSGVLCAVAVASLTLAVRLPYERLSSVAPVKASAHGEGFNDLASGVTLNALLQAAQLDLRRPLFDPPPPLPEPKPTPPPLAVTLAGTVIEPQHSRAILIGPDGRTQLKALGERIGDAEVLEIAPDSVTLRYLDNPVVLKVPKSGAGSAAP